MQTLRKGDKKPAAILGPVSSVLLILNDIPAKEPVANHQKGIHATASPALHLLVGALAELDKLLKPEASVHVVNPILSRWHFTFPSNPVTRSAISGSGVA